MEEWKDIPAYQGKYQVSNLGNVKSLNYNRTGEEKILKPVKGRDNYLHVYLCKNGKQKNIKIHRLVAEAFIPKIDGKEFVDHIDGNRQNNNVNNLRWCTQAENNSFDLARKHMSEAKQGRKNYMYGKTGKLHHRSKAVLCIELNKIFGSAMEVQRKLGIPHSNISDCCNGKCKSAGGYHWKFI